MGATAHQVEVLRYAAFTDTQDGGNPAGVVLSADGLSDAQMQGIAAEVGFSETAFLLNPDKAGGSRPVRYFSPLVEVSFCGHATVAMAVAYAERQGEGRLVLETKAGEVAVDTHKAGKEFSATFVSVPPHVREVGEGDLDEAVAALGWQLAELDEHLPPRIANAGNDHLVLAVRTRDRLAELDYDFDRLAGLMAQRNWTTLQLVWQESADRYHSRNPAPSLGVLEDAATGAAAAAFGGYLRELALVTLPARVTITQGVDMGRPSTLLVDIPETVDSGISISGSATQII